MKAATLSALVALAAAPAGLAAQELGFDHGRVRYADAGVTLQRASETGAEEAAPNMPFFPGDRVWTDGAARGEFQFKGGSVVRLESRSKLDYLRHDQAGSDEAIAIRLWSGSLILRVAEGRDQVRFEVEVPGGLVSVAAPGVYRVDAEAGETRLSVYQGEAVLDAARRRLTVEAGETVAVRRGEWPDEPRQFDRRDLDDFGRWDRERAALDYDPHVRSLSYLPAEVAPYGREFDAYGNWHYETEVGYVWSPRVQADWQPYTNGRWAWTAYGWTWVPYEPWGWAVSHYGRWGFSVGMGWYWVPGRVWGPGWVSWAHGGDYVGWCPLGYRDRPVGGLGYGSYRGTGQTGSRGPGWSFARRGDISARDFAKRRVDEGVVDRAGLRVVESARARPTRDLRSFETAPSAPLTTRERGIARDGVRARPSAELPWTGTLRRGDDEGRTAPSERRPEVAPREAARPRSERQPSRWDWPEDGGGTPSPRPTPRAHPLPGDTVGEQGRGAERARGSQPAPHVETSPRGEGAPRGEANPRSEARPRHREPDRDGMDRLFQPLVEPRSSAPRGESARPRTERPPPSAGSSRPERSRPETSAPRPTSPPRATSPPRQESRPPAQAAPRGGSAERRKPPRDQ